MTPFTVTLLNEISISVLQFVQFSDSQKLTSRATEMKVIAGKR